MIEITIEEFVLWVVGTAMVLVAFYVILTGAKHHREAKARVKKVIRCHGCGYVYHDDTRALFPECPECGRRNHRGKSKRLG